MKRLNNLDYLRGITAFGIMLFHYLSWTNGEFSSDAFLGRLGVYGVSVFYVLSGLTLYYVYSNKLEPTFDEILLFGKKRILRIFPLLWLATISSIILTREFPDSFNLALNLTGLFGFFKWEEYFATGAWSIGNELVFYTFFPVFLLLIKRSKVSFILLSSFIFSIYLFFAFSILDANQSLASQWRNYVNPLNQVFLFLGGILIGMVFKNVEIRPALRILILLVGLGVLIFYPSSGDPISLVTGTNRLVFTLSCLLICLSFYKINVELPAFADRPLAILGEASYSVYLLHPIVFRVIRHLFSISAEHLYVFPEELTIISSICVTLVVSYVVYEKFEKYFMRFGRSSEKLAKHLPVIHPASEEMAPVHSSGRRLS